jgi:hypothetical protein
MIGGRKVRAYMFHGTNILGNSTRAVGGNLPNAHAPWTLARAFDTDELFSAHWKRIVGGFTNEGWLIVAQPM